MRTSLYLQWIPNNGVFRTGVIIHLSPAPPRQYLLYSYIKQGFKKNLVSKQKVLRIYLSS